jgi:hypothetical protein
MEITRREFLIGSLFLEAMASADRWGLTNLDPRSVAVRNIYARQRQDS